MTDGIGPPCSSLTDRLRRRNPPIRVGISGAGFMGRGLLHQAAITPGISCAAISSRRPTRAREAIAAVGQDAEAVEDAAALARAVGRGRIAVCSPPEILAESENIDVLIEATSAIGPAGALCEAALRSGKHVVMVNAEADLTFGPYLMRVAQENGVIYTSADGDQHGVLKRLADDLTLWGFDLAMAGNVKGFLDRSATPTSIVPEADKRGLSYEIATAMTDGTKLAVEMALLANGLGLTAATPGMRGPRANEVADALRLFDADLRASPPFVDYLLGAEPGGGVFVVGRCDHPVQQRYLHYYKMGRGPFYLFQRPYHLCHVETMRTVAEAALLGTALLQPVFGFRTNVHAFAKRALRAGETLDGIGGHTCYGRLENCDAASEGRLPIALATDAVTSRAFARDEPIRTAEVEFDPDRAEIRMYQKALEAA